MKVEIKSEGSNYVEITMRGEDISLPNAIREILLNEPGIEFVSCTQDHPQIGAPKLVVRTKGKPALGMVKDAVKKLKKEVAEFKSELKEHKAKKKG
jgi:DNA-directed RNA polymerase subunit L